MKTKTPHNKLKEFAHSKESSFDNFDKVWNRIDEKLDNHKVIHKNKFWKTTAIAASVVLTTSLGFVIYFLMNQDQIVEPNNKIEQPSIQETVVSKEANSVIDTLKATKIIEEQKDVVVENSSKKDAIKSELSEKEFTTPIQTDSITKINTNSSFGYTATEVAKPMKIDQSFFNVATVNNSNILVKGKLFDALNNQEVSNAEEFDEIERERISRIANAPVEKRSSSEYTVLKNKDYDKLKKAESNIYRKKAKEDQSNAVKAEIADKKVSPLLVIDGVPIKNDYENETFDDQELDEFRKTKDLEDVVFLKEPVYYINGVEYTEESLFGKKPTSPYYPLEKQEMTSVYILKPEKAIPIYGKKGEKGVVIITTKNGKPAPKK